MNYIWYVKKMLVIIILFSFLGSTTELHEMLKLPHLFQHFAEHYTKSSGESFMEFLHDHYTHEHDDSGEQDEHHDTGCLPFQGKHHAQLSIFCGLYFEPTTGFDISLHTASCRKYYPISESFVSNHFSSIWQPPKIS